MTTETAQATTDAAKATTETKAAATTETKGATETKATEKQTQTQTEAKAEVKTETKDTGKETTETTKSVVPEKYDLKLSDQSVLDPTIVDKVAAIAREHGLSNEQAQAYLADVEKDTKATIDGNVKRWNDEIKADKELGGDNFAATDANVKRARDRFVPKDSAIDKLLTRTGYGSNPEVVRLFNEIGKAMAEGKPLHAQPSAGGGGAAKPAADVLYGKT